MKFPEGEALTVGELKAKITDHDDGEVVSLLVTVEDPILDVLFQTLSRTKALSWELTFMTYEATVARNKAQDQNLAVNLPKDVS